jgi:HAD superfamily hydrolase (TIGR01509 family)
MFGGPVEAVIFDMDGTLIDSEAVYITGMQQAARSLGVEMSLDFCHSMVGVAGPECNVMIQRLYGAAFDLARFRGVYSGVVRRLLAERIPVKAGVIELLDFLGSQGLPCAVATSAARPTVEHHLGRAGLLDRFAAIATRDDVEHPKPAPDIYLEAARRLGVAPHGCIAFEDSSIGIAAAHAAGMRAIMVLDILPPTDDARAKCLHVAHDLHEVLRLMSDSVGHG